MAPAHFSFPHRAADPGPGRPVRGAGSGGARIAALLLCALAAAAAGAQDVTARTVVDLQPFRASASLPVQGDDGRRGTATLIDLNPRVHAWLLLTLEWDDGQGGGAYHLENRAPALQRIRLDARHPGGVVIRSGGEEHVCALWSRLAAARAERRPYAPLCGGRLDLRNPTAGHKTTREWATDFLRNYVPGGERLTVFVRETFYRDAFLDSSEPTPAPQPGASAARPRPPGAPAPARIDPRHADRYLAPAELGIELAQEIEGRVLAGRWYRAAEMPGVFVSAVEPRLVAEAVVRDHADRLNPPDAVEAGALAYLIAFDLSRFAVDFAVGTEHPRVDWSGRIQPSVREPDLAGPDGIGTIEPLVATGIVHPALAGRVAAAFTGGFKRFHGAFRHGALALRNRGSHYGFVESGVVLSALQPGLATALVLEDGRVELGTWGEGEAVELERIRHARQNGVPLVEPDPGTGSPRPGALVAQSAAGNWSGSVDGRYRTLRAGLAVQENGGSRFLIYGYFSTATPSAMARVFLAYGCRYAMLLDMNALEHTYLALYPPREGGPFQVQHLVKGMSVLDKTGPAGELVPRFVGYADNRDFFYLSWRDAP